MCLADGLDFFGAEVGLVVSIAPERVDILGATGLSGWGVHGGLLKKRTGYLRAFRLMLSPVVGQQKTLLLQRAAAAGLCAGVVVDQLT